MVAKDRDVRKYRRKTKAQLIEELASLEKRVQELTPCGANTGDRGVDSDITGGVTAQEKALVVQNHLAEAIGALSEGCVLYDADDRFVASNTKYRELYATLSDILVSGLRFEDWARAYAKSGQDRDTVGREEEWHEQRMREHRNPTEPKECRLADGRYIRLMEYRTSFGGTVGLCRDITETKRAEEALRESEKNLREIFGKSPIGIAIVKHTRENGRVEANRLFVNDALVQMIGGTSAEQMIEMDISTTWVDLNQLNEVNEALKSGADLVDFEAQRRRVNGDEWWISMSTRPIRFDDQDCTMVWHFDITELKQTEQALRKSESQLLEAQRIAQLGSWELNLVTGDLIWSDEIYRMFEIDSAQFSASYEAFLDAIHPDDRAMVNEAYMNSLANRSPYQINHRLRMSDGRIKLVHERCETEFDANGKPLVSRGTVQDITESKKAEAAARSSESRLSGIVEIASDAIITIDGDQRVSTFNKGAEQIFGHAAGDVLGQPVDMLIPEASRSAHSGHIAEFAGPSNASRPMSDRGEIAGLRKDGTLFPAEASIMKLELDGETVFTVILRDITQRKAVEEQLRQSQKLEVVGQLTGGMAHDFNNLLGVIIGNLDILEEQLQGDSSLRDLVESATKAALSGADLNRRLLAFSRKQSLSPKVIDLNEHLSGTLDMLRRTLGETIKIEAKHSDGKRTVKADPSQLESTLLNIAVNARDAMPDGGKLTIEATKVRLDDDYVLAHPYATPGEFVMLAVTDTGTGMSPEVLGHVFEPFFTTKDVGKGSGLGLSMVFGFTKQSGGHVEIESEEGVGTTVKLYLPYVQREPVASPEATEEIPEARDETVLVVEDDPGILTLTVNLLGSLGYEVLEAKDGRTALTVLEGDSGVDLLLTDVVMPGGMGGPALAEEAVTHRPEIKVLLMSGYTPDAMRNQGQPAGDTPLLRKPFRKPELARTVRTVLDT